jgi:hypothetical protein
MSRENKTKINMMIKSDEHTVGKFNKFRVSKKCDTTKASPNIRKPKLDDNFNLFSLMNPIEKQASPTHGSMTQKYQNGRLSIGSSYSKKQPQKMFKVRKQHFANLKMNLVDQEDAYMSNGNGLSSRQ